MKIRGKRILKNGTTAGYIKQKDGSWKWRFITGPRKRQSGGHKKGEIIEYRSGDGYFSRGKIIEISGQNNVRVKRISYKDKKFFSNDIFGKEEDIHISNILKNSWIIKKQAYTNNRNMNYYKNCNDINKSQVINTLPPVEFLIYLNVHGHIDEDPVKIHWKKKRLSTTLDDDVNIIYLASAGNMTTDVHDFIFKYIFIKCYEKDGYVLDNNGCPSEEFEKFKKFVRTEDGRKWLKDRTNQTSNIYINNLVRVINTIHLNPPGSVINTQYLELKKGMKFNAIYVKDRNTKEGPFITRNDLKTISMDEFINVKKEYLHMYIGEFIKEFKKYIQTKLHLRDIRFTFVSGACRQEFHRSGVERPTISRGRSMDIIGNLSLRRQGKKQKYDKVLSYLVKKYGPRRETIKKEFIDKISEEDRDESLPLLEDLGYTNLANLNIGELKQYLYAKIKNHKLLGKIHRKQKRR